MHADDLILQGFADFLAGIPGLEDHVTTDSEQIPDAPELPWCFLQLGDFTITGATVEGKKFRSVIVQIILITASRFGPMQKANSLAAVIEDRVDANPRLGGLLLNSTLQGGERLREETLARVQLTYSADYSTAAGAVSTP